MASSSLTEMLTGVTNLGYTGWLSTVLQCLANTDPLRDYILSGEYKKEMNRTNRLGSKDARITDELAKLIIDMYNPAKTQPVNPSKLVSMLADHNFYNKPHDHQAAMACLIDILMEDTNKVIEKPYIEAPIDNQDDADAVLAQIWWDNHHKRNDSKIGEMFEFQLKSQTRCFTCDEVSRRFEPSLFLQLPVPDDKEEKKLTTTTLAECLEHFQRAEVLKEKFCSNCKDFKESERQRSLYRLPQILMVHLKRFRLCRQSRRKLNTLVNFPLKGLDLSAFVDADNKKKGDDEVGKFIYDCYAVCNHDGNMNGGVYTAYILGRDGTWRHCNDTVVRGNVNPQAVVSSSAYVLYYRRRDVALSKEFAEHQPTEYPLRDVCLVQ